MNVVPGNFQMEIEEKWNQKKSLALISRLLGVFTQQLEILVTTLHYAWWVYVRLTMVFMFQVYRILRLKSKMDFQI